MSWVWAIAGAVVFGFVMWKFVWPDMRENFSQLAAYRRTAGTPVFILLIGGTLLFIGLIVWLAMRLDYPNAYGHPCEGRGCLLMEIYYSPSLLKTHRWDEMLLFLLLMTFPAVIAGSLIYAGVRKLRGQKLSLYSDDTE